MHPTLTKFFSRCWMLAHAAQSWLSRSKVRPTAPQKIIVVSRFLLGDTLMLAPLLAALRERYPTATIYVAVQAHLLQLFSYRPYSVIALPFDLETPSSLIALRRTGPYDLGIVPGDNRHGVAARAFDARWVVAIAGDHPEWKNRVCDELVPLPSTPGTIYDAFMEMASPGANPIYAQEAWSLQSVPMPPQLGGRNYILLHAGSSSITRRWTPSLWASLADALTSAGHLVCWSAGPGEESVIQEIDPLGRFPNVAGKLDLYQLWSLVKNAALLISIDTSVVHIAKLTGCPTVCLYGPGGEALVGKGRFFRNAPIAGIVVAHFRDRRDGIVFKRKMPWARPVVDTPLPTDDNLQLAAVLAEAQRLLTAQA